MTVYCSWQHLHILFTTRPIHYTSYSELHTQWQPLYLKPPLTTNVKLSPANLVIINTVHKINIHEHSTCGINRTLHNLIVINLPILVSRMYIRPLPSRCPVYTNYILRLKLIQNGNEKSELILQFELLSGCYIWCVHGVERFPSFQGMYRNEERYPHHLSK